MPQSITIAAFVFGAVLILLSLIVGKFELFGAKVDGTVGKTGRIIAFVLGIFLIGKGLNLDTSPQPVQPSPNASHADSAAAGETPAARTEPAASPAPPPTNTAPDFGNFLQGVWYARVPAVTGEIEATVRYFPDHSFNGTQSGIVAGYRSTQPVRGTWNVRTLSPNEFILSMDYLGAGPISSTFRVIDDNSIENEGQQYIAHRTSR